MSRSHPKTPRLFSSITKSRGTRDYSIAELKHNVIGLGKPRTPNRDRRDHDGARQHVGTDVS